MIGLKGDYQRLMLSGVLLGLFMYSGLGAADIEVSSYFGVAYCIFSIALVLSFRLSSAVMHRSSERIAERLSVKVPSIDYSSWWRWVIVIYVATYIFPLIWPNFILMNVLQPAAPDIRDVFLQRVQVDRDSLSAIIGYLNILLTPFYYIAIYRWRNDFRIIAFITVLLLYLQYVNGYYIGRGTVMLNLVLLAMAIWFYRPNYRIRLVAFIIFSAPFLLYGLYLYSIVRIGGVADGLGISESIRFLLDEEFGFPRNAGMALLESNKHVDLGKYFLWIVTLPIPKILIGAIDVARLNYEISSIVLGIPISESGWYVVLPGVVGESFYIFGAKLFWIHGIMLGFLSAALARIIGRVKELFFLQLYTVLLFAYVLNRAGIGALLPTVINGYLLFFMYCWIRPALSSYKKVPN